MGSIYDIALLMMCGMLLITAGAILRAAFGRHGGEVGGWEWSGAWRRMRAVARITLAEGLRMRIAIVFVVLLLVTLPLLCVMSRGDGTLKGRVQMFIGYSVGLTAFYLSLLTIFFSSRTLAMEIASRQIYGVATKPVPRWQILAGKWLGVMTLDVGLVAIAMVFTYGGTRWIVHSFERQLSNELVARGGLSDGQAELCIDAIRNVRGPGGQGISSPIIPALSVALGWSNDQVIEILKRLPESVRIDIRRLDELRRQVLVARASVAPTLPDVSDQVEKNYAMLAQQGQLPQSPEWTPARVRNQIRMQLLRDYTTIAPGDRRQWTMQGPVPRADQEFLLSVRYKLAASAYPPAGTLADGMPLPENGALVEWIVGDPQGPNYFMWPTRPIAEILSSFHEFEVPNHVVEADGTIKLTAMNVDPRGFDIVAAPPDGIEVLYRLGSFEENIVRAGIAILIPLLFLAAFGLMMSTFCTFPVAAMVTLVFFAVSGSRGFLAESLSMTPDTAPDYLTPREELRKMATDALFDVVSLGELDPSGKLIEGRIIRNEDLYGTASRVIGIRGGLAMAIGVLVFRRRELASIIV